MGATEVQYKPQSDVVKGEGAAPLRRWPIVIAGLCVQLAFGAFYAWSVFRIPLANEFHWTISQVTLVFTVCVIAMGCGGFWGGVLMNHIGPQAVLRLSACLWGGGVFLASFTDHRLWWLCLTYGLLGGSGLGSGFIVPVAVLVKWFPERRGLVAGIAVFGFGAGPMIVAPIATQVIRHSGPMAAFAYLGLSYLIVVLLGSSFIKNPPAGWKPEGWEPTAAQLSQRATKDTPVSEAVKTWQFWGFAALHCLSSVAGMAVASQAAPIFEEMGRVTAVTAGTFVGIMSVTNGFGRLFWAWTSDVTSRRATYFTMFLLRIFVFWYFTTLHSPLLLLAVACFITSCDGGGYAVMPAFIADYFGSKYMGAIFGLVMVPYGLVTAFGPLLFAHLRQITGLYTDGLLLIAGVMAVSMIVPILMRPPRPVR